MSKLSQLAAAIVTVVAGSSVLAGEVEVLHWWTSGGEARSAGELKKIMQSKGHTWKDFAVAGGGGDNAMTVLKRRVVAGNPPAAAQIKGPAIQQWASEGVLANLDVTAKAEKWDELLPKVVADVMKYQGNYVAAPVNVHRVNWMWANSAVLKKAGVAAVPKTWDEFFAAAEKVKMVGLIAVAHGGQNWQDFTTFEDVVLGVGGAKFYHDALVRLDPKALTSPTMTKSLETFRRIKSYTDPASPGRDWNLATAMVIQEKAAFQFMGDWAKGEFSAAGKVPGKDYICAAAPGTANAYTFNVDSFVMFKLKEADAQKAQAALAAAIMGDWAKGEFSAAGKVPGKDYICAAAPGTAHAYTFNVDSFVMFKLKEAGAQKAQAALAAAIMGVKFQEVFNLNKGSIPVRLNMNMAKFDDCAKLSSKHFVESAKSGGLQASVAHGMAVKPAAEGAIKDAVSQFWNDDKISVADAVKNLAKAAATQ